VEPACQAKQLQNRLAMRQAERLPSDFEAIAILVERIKHPQSSLADLAGKLKERNMVFEPMVIENLFLRHGLVTKKNDI